MSSPSSTILFFGGNHALGMSLSKTFFSPWLQGRRSPLYTLPSKKVVLDENELNNHWQFLFYFLATDYLNSSLFKDFLS